MTCGRAQEFLARKHIAPREVVDAKKERKGPGDALALAREANDIYVAKGKKVVHFNMQDDKPSNEQLLAVLRGPSSILRAPTMRKGKTLLVGFEPETFAKLLS